MVETNHVHHHAPPSSVMAPPMATSIPGGARVYHNPNEQLHQLHYCIHSNPAWPAALLLAFQHYIVMLGSSVMIATLLVPLMGGSNGDKARVIQTLTFMGGINTLLQTLFGTRLPTVMGSSFAFIIPVLSIINDFNDSTFTSERDRFRHTMRAIQGSLIVASFVNIIIGYSKIWGHYTRSFSPVSIVPMVCVVGLGLYERGFPKLAQCVEIGLPTLVLLVVGQNVLRRFHKQAHTLSVRFGVLFCIGFVWAFAAVLTVAGAYNYVRVQTKLSCRTDRSYLISTAPWIKVPYPFQWGAPIFRASHVFGMMGAALVSSAESTATFIAASRLSGATPPPAHVLSRSIGLQGVGMLIEGIFGAAVGTSASVENVGLLGLTQIGSRRVVEISTGFMLFFSIFGKFGAFFASIPLPIFAAVYCVLFGIVGECICLFLPLFIFTFPICVQRRKYLYHCNPLSVGLMCFFPSNLVAATGISYLQFVNYNSLRNIYVLGISLFLGISVPQYFHGFKASTDHYPINTPGGWFNDIFNTIFSSSPTVAMIVGTVLDNLIDSKHTVSDRGLPWWTPFQYRDGDVRNDEFYSYPLRLHEYIPSRFRD